MAGQSGTGLLGKPLGGRIEIMSVFSETKNHWQGLWRGQEGMRLTFEEGDDRTIGCKTRACIFVTQRLQEGTDLKIIFINT